MPVRDLAPALLALGDLFADAGALVNPAGRPVALNIRATQEGSFVVQLILESPWEEAIDLLSADPLSAILNLKELIIGTGGLIWLIGHLWGRRVTREEELPEPGQIRLTLDDGTVLEVSAEVLGLYGNLEVRKKTREVLEPLAREGVEVVEFHDDDHTSVRVMAGDLAAYDVPEVDEVALGDDVSLMVVSIAAVAFVEGNKWRLSDGERTFYAAMLDEDFLGRVDRGVAAFRKGDMLRCRIRIRQSQRAEGLHTEYEVVEVVEHLPSAIQLELGAGDD